ncbi:MAG: putative Ig domain-containing protein [Candidatus Korobacteraceae bacterium]
MPTTRHSLLLTSLFILLGTALTAYSQTAMQFVAVTPCRVADTRKAPGQFGGPTMGPGTERDFPVPLSACSIPDTATAYSLNVTVVPWGSLNYLTIWPTGQQQPVVSTLNSYDGRTKANAAIVPAGTNGAVSVYVTDKTDVILDIDGYFAPATTSTLALFPLTPCRVADTRWSKGPLGGPALLANQQRIFPVLASDCNVPDTAEGYSLNFTVIPQTTLNYLTVWPTGLQQPVVSTLNAPTGTIVANAALVPAGTSGAISVYVTDATNLVIDIDGYFAPANSGADALSLYTLTPCRVLDTRSAGGAFSGTLPVDVLGSACSVPSAQAYVFNATVVPKGPLGYLTLWPDAEGQPVVSTLNAVDGAVTSNMAIVPTLNGDVDAFAYSSTNLILDIFSYFAPILPLNVTTTALPSGTLTYNYNTTVMAAGGVLPYTWSLASNSGNLPPSLLLNSGTGVISGTPTLAGNYPLTVQVTDSESPPAKATASLGITVNSTLTQLTITTTTLPNGTQNSPYNAPLAATGGVTPYTWSLVSGTLPSGLILNSGTGAITGTPTGAGISTFTVQVADSENPVQTATRQLSITINPAVPLSISTTSLPNGTVGTQYSAPITAIGGVYPYTWAVISGTLPSGLSLNSSTGTISGTPQNAGQSNFTVQVTDSETPAVKATAQLSILINPAGGGNLGLLSGNYAFYLNGFNSSGSWTLAGSFISNGNGSITSGVVDGNSMAGQPFMANVTGNYSISTTGLNLITLQGQSWGPMTFAFVLDSTGNGRMIEYDDTTGQGSRGSGALRKANSSTFALSALNGNWVYGGAGTNYAGVRTVVVSEYTLTAGNITNGAMDTNEGGTYKTGTFTGTMSAVDPQSGRVTATIYAGGEDNPFVGYVVSISEMVMESLYPQHPQAGSVLRQSGTFSKGTLNGLAVSYYQSIGGEGDDRSGAALLSCNGNGTFNILAEDDDDAGTITQGQPEQGTYTVGANGAANFSGGGDTPAGFLISHNKGFMVSIGSNPDFYWLEPQTGGPFSNASMAGSYAGGTLPPLDYVNAHDEADVGSADGLGTLTFSGDSSGSDGLDQAFGQIVNYNIAANGRGTAESQGDHAPNIVYMISPTKWVVMLPKTDARMAVFQH